jgi:hypothetical protein
LTRDEITAPPALDQLGFAVGKGVCLAECEEFGEENNSCYYPMRRFGVYANRRNIHLASSHPRILASTHYRITALSHYQRWTKSAEP